MARVEASWEDPTGASQAANATLEDRSTAGASIRLGKPLSVGSKLKIKWHREQFSGTVMNCRLDGRHYIIGILRDSPEAAPKDLR
jgi:hypothetical protein